MSVQKPSYGLCHTVGSQSTGHIHAKRTQKQGVLEPPSSGPWRQSIGQVREVSKRTVVYPNFVLMLNVLDFRFICVKLMWWGENFTCHHCHQTRHCCWHHHHHSHCLPHFGLIAIINFIFTKEARNCFIVMNYLPCEVAWLDRWTWSANFTMSSSTKYFAGGWWNVARRSVLWQYWNLVL